MRATPCGLRRWALALALGALACGRPPERVVLISIDTLRADHVGAYGATRAHTPTLDGLAARGVRFAHAFSPAPLTLPSHASLLTGLDPPQHGVRNNGGFRLPEEVATLAEVLRAGGFATAAFVGAFVLDRQFGLARGFDVYDDRMAPRRAAGATGFAERRADAVVDAALAWLAGAPERFFLFVHLYDPHANYDPPPGFRASFPNRPYAGEIAFADAQLGRLLAALRERWPDERTLVVATSDHGESLGEHGEATHAYTLYDATQRVPLLLAGPGLPAGAVVTPLVRLVDVAPTVLALTGQAALPETAGRDLRALVSGREREPRTAYLETLAPQLDFGWSPLLAVRTHRHKYVSAPRPELYDVQTDPGELRDVAAAEPELAGELAALLEARAVGAGTRAQFVAPRPEDRRRLRSLGYVVSGEEVPAAELGRVGGPDPKDELPVLALLSRADALCAAGRAREAWELVREVPPGGSVARSARARVALLAGEFEISAAEAGAAARLDPGSADVQLVLGLALLGLGRADAARSALAESHRLDPALSDPLVALGVLEEMQGERARAAERYAEALAARSPALEARWRLAALRLEEERFAEADALLDDLPADALRQPEVAVRLAVAEAGAGRIDAALRRLEASGVEPEAALAAIDRAIAAAGGADLERLLELRRRAADRLRRAP
jgi:arylsulfatase A-like enzyme/Tfp pilus assembly protein PilF